MSKLEHRDDHSPQTIEHGKIKIAKLASNTARTTAVAEFMKTVAGNLTARVGDTNMGAEVKVHTDQMKLDASGTRSSQIEYGGALLKMQVDENGEVQMTDLLNNDTAFQKKLDGLDVRLAGFGQYVAESEKFVKDPNVMKTILKDSTENLPQSSASNPRQSFKKNIKKRPFSKKLTKQNGQ